MGFLGGDITEATCLHPTLGSFRYFPKANEAFTLDKGGFRSNDEASSVTAMGQNINVLSRVRWSVEGPVAVDMLADGESSSLNAMAADPDDGVWTFSHISGAIYKGTGRPVGDLNTDSNTSQLKLKVAGGGLLEEIA